MDLINAWADAIYTENGEKLLQLLAVDNVDAQQAVFEKLQSRPAWDPAPDCRSRLRQRLRGESVWEEVVEALCCMRVALVQGNAVAAIGELMRATGPFNKLFREDMGTWLVRPMGGFVRALRDVGAAANVQAKVPPGKNGYLGEAAAKMNALFSSAHQGAGNRDKKMAALDVVIVLFQVYFRLNTLRMCKSLINAVNSPQFLPFDAFPASQRVTYRFFVGRLAIFAEDYNEAEEHLTYAFEHCHARAARNKAAVARFLIPVRMLLGALPAMGLLEAFGLTVYAPFAEAMRTGSVQQLNESLQANQAAFIHAGTYLLMEKLRQAVCRRLLKRVWLLHRESDPDKAHQLPLVKFQAALAAQGAEMDIDEVECLVANLIFRGYVKGYLSHRHHVAVLSKNDAFPALTAAMLADPNI
ncbi:hypothetical protein WJX81_003800 [Elliptochloris bilobata]|uniref:PCI domain-containing protein n=1 Tax=Elliptochloris bilobata TaxID=381761 RepID=A0AAW1RXI9_9CHLO